MSLEGVSQECLVGVVTCSRLWGGTGAHLLGEGSWRGWVPLGWVPGLAGGSPCSPGHRVGSSLGSPSTAAEGKHLFSRCCWVGSINLDPVWSSSDTLAGLAAVITYLQLPSSGIGAALAAGMIPECWRGRSPSQRLFQTRVQLESRGSMGWAVSVRRLQGLPSPRAPVQ